MKHEHVRETFRSYLSQLGSEILYQNSASIQVKLSEEADRKIANRPFYWAFIDRTNTSPEPLLYTFYFSSKSDTDLPNPNTLVEVITNGNEMFDLLINDINRCGKSVMLFENPLPASQPMSYESWLNVNIMITYQTSMNKSELLSIGLSLNSGEIVTQFMENVLSSLSFTPKVTTFTSSFRIQSISSSIALLKTYLNDYLLSANHTWALTSPSHPSIFAPKITIEIINCGIFHLLNQTRIK